MSAVPFLKLRDSPPGEEERIDQLEKSEHDYVPAANKRGRRNITLAYCSYTVFLHGVIIYLLLGGRDWVRSTDTDVDGQSWSPIHGFIKYELNSDHATNHSVHSPYSGPPTPSQDDAWDHLIKPMFFNASMEELRRSGERLENLAAVQGGGYAATIGAYHELHCLRQLRFYVFKERYYPHLTASQAVYLRGHLDHCIETLRLTVMCYGNPSMVSFAWEGNDISKPITQSSSTSMCAKWESIDTWARSRAPENYALVDREWPS